MILEYYLQPETGENWLIVRRIGATGAELWRPVTEYRRGAEALHLATIDRVRLDTLVSRGLHPKVRATASDWYAHTGRGFFGRYAQLTSNANTTTRERGAFIIRAHRELYEYAGAYYEH